MEGTKKFSCKCGVAFTSERSLNFHRGSRACRLRDPAAVRYSCPDCKFTAYYQITLDKHIQIRHSNKTPFECKCGAKFGSLEVLLAHQEATLSCQKYHTCKLCGHISPTQGQLNRHLRSHSEEKPFVCGCGRAYPRKDSYYRHKRTCKDESSDKDTQPVAIAVKPQMELPAPNLVAQPAQSSIAGPPSATAGTPQLPPAINVPTPVLMSDASQPPSLPPLGQTAASQTSKKFMPTLPPPNALPHLRAFYSQPPPQLVQVHAPMFIPHYSSHYVRMNMNTPQETSHMEPPAPPPVPSQLMNLSYLASMKPPLNLPVPSDDDVPALGAE